MSITVDYSLSPWLITVPQSDLTLDVGTQYKLDVDVFWTLLRDYADSPESMPNPIIYTRIPATASTPSITEVNSGYYQIQFEDGLYSVNIINGNTNIREVEVKNQVSVNTNNTTGFIDAEFLEHSTFGGGVSVDETGINSVSGTTYPAGTPGAPCDNINDAHTILIDRGFKKFFILSDMSISTEDFSDGVTFEGVSSISTALTLLPATDVNNCIFSKFTVTGTLDNNNRLENCLIDTITSFDGFMENCGFNDSIAMGGSAQTTLVNCYSNVAGNATPTISIGTGSALAIRGYKGGIELQDKIGTDACSIDMESGQVVVASSCTVGVINLRGTAELTNNTGGTYVRDFMAHNTDSAILRQLVELQRPHHTGLGKMIFWNPYGGDDTRNGDHIDRAVKTFAQAQNLADDNAHDMIVAVSGDPTGNTVTNENIVITKNYLFLRGPGRDFRMHSTNDLLNTIEVSGNGVEVSGMIVSTELTNTQGCIHTSGNFPLLKNLYVTDSANGIHMNSGTYGQIQECRVSGHTGFGVLIDGTSEHVTVQSSHVGSNGGDGITINLDASVHEVIIADTVIHKNTGWGINISATSRDTVIRSDTVSVENTAGNINDLGSNTIDYTGWVGDIQVVPTAAENTDELLNRNI